MSTEQRVKAIIAEIIGSSKDKILPTASFKDDLGADSLDIVELIMAFEDEFNIDISDEDADKIHTVGEAISYIEAKV
jgi:acyl carrier protein